MTFHTTISPTSTTTSATDRAPMKQTPTKMTPVKPTPSRRTPVKPLRA